MVQNRVVLVLLELCNPTLRWMLLVVIESGFIRRLCGTSSDLEGI